MATDPRESFTYIAPRGGYVHLSQSGVVFIPENSSSSSFPPSLRAIGQEHQHHRGLKSPGSDTTPLPPEICPSDWPGPDPWAQAATNETCRSRQRIGAPLPHGPMVQGWCRDSVPRPLRLPVGNRPIPRLFCSWAATYPTPPYGSINTMGRRDTQRAVADLCRSSRQPPPGAAVPGDYVLETGSEAESTPRHSLRWTPATPLDTRYPLDPRHPAGPLPPHWQRPG